MKNIIKISSKFGSIASLAAFSVLALAIVSVMPNVAKAEVAATCSVSSVPGSVTWNAVISTGTAPYTIQFAGTSFDASNTQTGTWTANPDGTATSITRPYSSYSKENVILTVADSEGGVMNTTCEPATVYPVLTVTSCSATPASATVGDPVNWTAVINGGLAPYTLNWSGSDGLSGSSNTVSINYTTSGSKTAKVVTAASSDGQVATVNLDCAGSVTVNATSTASTTPTDTGTGGSTTTTGSYAGGGVGGGSGSSIPVSGFGAGTSTPGSTGNEGGAGSSPTTLTWPRTLAIGSRGDDVLALQNLLKNDGLYCGQLTGYYGPVTAEGVRAYQAAHGIFQSGMVGELTLADLNNGVIRSYTPVDCDAVFAQLEASGALATTGTSTATTTGPVSQEIGPNVAAVAAANTGFMASVIGAFANNWISIVIWALIIIALLGIIWFFFILKKGDDDEENA